MQLVTTSGVVVHVREDLDLLFTSSLSSAYHILQLPFWTRGDSWPIVRFFLPHAHQVHNFCTCSERQGGIACCAARGSHHLHTPEGVRVRYLDPERVCWRDAFDSGQFVVLCCVAVCRASFQNRRRWTAAWPLLWRLQGLLTAT